MKHTILFLFLGLSFGLQAQNLDRSIRPKPGPAPEIKIAEAKSFTLPNGLKVFVVENTKLPRVTASIQFDIDPVMQGNMAGYTEMIGEMMSAGTKKRSKDRFNLEVDKLGASIGANESGVFASGLKRHQEKLFELMSDMVINPAFPAAELDKLKKQAESGLQANKEDANAIANNIASVVNYGKAHPYGEVMTEATLKNINVDAFRKFHNTYGRPNVAYMAIVGDITFADAQKLVTKYFGGWQKAEVPKSKLPMVKAPAKNTVYVAQKEGAVQSVISVTHPIELKKGTPDVIPARLMNQILGGGSSGYLFLNLREKHGWTYGSYSDVAPDQYVGTFSAEAQSRNAVTDSSIGEILNEMKRIRTQLVSNEELQNQKNLASGTFAMGLENPQTIANYAIAVERYGMPKDYYKNYLKNIAAVTPADIQAVAKKYVQPENANIIVVGNVDEVQKKLEQFGKVEVRDVYGNPVTVAPKTAAPAGVTADAIYKKYVAAIGGEKALNALKDLKVIREAEMQGQKLNITITQKSPDKFLQTVGMGSMVFQKKMINGNSGYEEAQGQKQEMDADDVKSSLEDADLQAELHPERYGIKRTLRNQDGNLYVVDVVNAQGKKSVEYYDATSGLLVKETSTEEGPQGPVSMTTEFLDYKEVPGGNGYKIPYTVKVPIGPGMFIDAKVIEVQLNKGIDDSIFK